MLFRNRGKKYVLMHKDIPVMRGEYDLDKHAFKRVDAILKEAHMPVGTVYEHEISLERLNHWIRWRGIPDYRVGLDQLMDKLDVEHPTDLLDMEYGLSVSDHYWLKPINDKNTYEDLNFFERGFAQEEFGRAQFSTIRFEASEEALHTPNNTLCGYHRKAWFHRGDDLYLYKGGSPWFQQEPIMEWLTGVIGCKLGMDVIDYDVMVYENQLVSVCKNMLDLDTDLVPADDILFAGVKKKGEFVLDYYMNLLESHEVPDAMRGMDEMMVLDFMLMNTDRHNQNFGILVDANNMRWKSVAPVFDTGTCLGALKSDEDLKHIQEFEYKLFRGRVVIDEKLMGVIVQHHGYDFSALDDVPEMLVRKLAKYQKTSGIRNERIQLLGNLLIERIKRMKRLQLKAGG